MAEKVTYHDISKWISDKTTEVVDSRYEFNYASMQQGLQSMQQHQSSTNERATQINNVIQQTADVEAKRSLQSAYDNLKAVIEKKIDCIKTMIEVLKLQEKCTDVSHVMDVKSTDLTRQYHQQDQQTDCTPPKYTGFIGVMSQDCVFGLRDSWSWIQKLMKCCETHLNNAANYHQFFHEVAETEPWMLQEMNELSTCLDDISLDRLNDQDTQRVEQQLRTALTSLRQWEARLHRIWQSAVNLTPVPLRVDGVKEPTPAQILVDYKTSEIHVQAGEDVLLLENSDPQMWKVRNGRNQESMVPAVIVLIRGPCAEAIDSAARLRLQLLTAWTTAVKRIGVRLFQLLFEALKPHYNQHEIATLTQFRDMDKQSLVDFLSFIETALQKYWADQPSFVDLQERILALRMILEEIGDNSIDDDALFTKLFNEISFLAKLVELYQAMFNDWEKFKVAVETSREPDFMLILENWKQLQFVPRDYFAKFWKSTVALEGLDQTGQPLTIDGVQIEDTIDTGLHSHKVTEVSVASGQTDVTDSGLDSGKVSRLTSGQLDERSKQGQVKDKSDVTAVSEVKMKRGGVMTVEIDTSGGMVETVDEISETKILRPVSQEEVGGSFGMAAARELKSAETEQLTAAEGEEKKTFAIRSVVNPTDGTEISLQQAIVLGIIQPDEGLYVNSVTGLKKPIPTAMSEGLIKVTFTSTKREKEKTSSIGIITVKTTRDPVRSQSIVSVRNTQTGTDLTDQQAVNQGVLDQRREVFTDKKTGRRMTLTEATEAGLVKIDYIGEAPEPETVSKTYAVRAVVDRRQKKTVTFHEAVQRGIIDRESGAFRDTITGDKMYVGDAIMRGFLKARIIDDDAGLDIDPENKMVIEKTEKIRKRLLKPLSVISAFKLAAASAHK